MSLKIREISDPPLIIRCEEALRVAGYNVSGRENHVTVSEAGFADKSVDFTIRVVDLDGHRLLQFTSVLADSNESFERVALAVARGNMHCHTVSFSPVEQGNGAGASFSVLAQTHIYADYFSDAELTAMVYLFTRELDDVDNELRAILSGE